MNTETPDRAWKLLSRRGSWTQGKYTRNKNGEEVQPYSPDAVKFCALGAITKVYGNEHGGARRSIQVAKFRKFLSNSVWIWNDTKSRRRSQVVALLKRFGI